MQWISQSVRRDLELKHCQGGRASSFVLVLSNTVLVLVIDRKPVVAGSHIDAMPRHSKGREKGATDETQMPRMEEREEGFACSTVNAKSPTGTGGNWLSAIGFGEAWRLE